MYTQFELGRNFLVRAEHDSDLVQFVTELAEKEGITVATFTAIGALKRAKLEFYDQEKHEYREIALDSPQEIASCVGNISVKDGRTFVHAHAVLADKNGNTKAGHLLEGVVFAAEVHLRELKGAKLERKYDTVTGLSLWET
ncbi:MAG: DNA-binding protein [Candidatus Bathyarchaeota archaeon]|nr:DNA-binding protein [Candidatus Bathyarchaeota archaeon]